MSSTQYHQVITKLKEHKWTTKRGGGESVVTQKLKLSKISSSNNRGQATISKDIKPICTHT